MRLFICILAGLLLLALLMSSKSDTCVVLFGDDQQWEGLVQGVVQVLPDATLKRVTDPGVDFEAYATAVRELSPQFTRMVCQIPNKAVQDIVRRRAGDTVAVATDPGLASGHVVANIVSSQQALANALLDHCPVVDGKKLLVSTSTCRVPKGWAQMQPDKGMDWTNKLSSMKYCVIVVSDPGLASPSVIAALQAGNPRSVILAATTNQVPQRGLLCQVSTNQLDAGRLAACLCMLGRRYRGQQTLVVDPLVVKPSVSIRETAATSLKQLQKLSSM